MKHVLIAGAASSGLIFTMATAANAAHVRPHHDDENYSKMYPSATPRQLKNLEGYENGGYYELDSNAVPFGSRVWWELKQREGGGH
jgi:hypothetical protein